MRPFRLVNKEGTRYVGRQMATTIGKLFKSKWGKLGIGLVILNEIRGLAVVGAILLAWFR